MKPLILFQEPLIQAYHCDCMDFMADKPDNYYDLAIVDPPYGIFSKKKSANMNWVKHGTGGTWASKYGKKVKEWDVAPNKEYFRKLKRISKNQIIWGANHYGYSADNYIIWKKLTISENFSMGMCEFASVSLKGNPKVFEYPPQDYNRFHPTQKPIKLYRWILSRYAKPGEKIFDSHGGSFSSAIACALDGFEMDICEIDQEYFDAAIKRFKEQTCQIQLF